MNRKSKVSRICLICGKDFLTWKSNVNKGWGRYCSKGCAKTGKTNPRWKGGISTSAEGYCLIKIYRNHPLYCMADHRGYVYEHRLIMARFLNRPLPDIEVVHHINGDRSNNNIDNLMLFKNDSEHQSYHAQQRRLQAAV